MNLLRRSYQMPPSKPHIERSLAGRAWRTPLAYSKLRLQRDWRITRAYDHVVGEEPSDSWLVLVLRTVNWIANAASPWEWLNFALVRLFEPHRWLRSKDRIKARYWIGDVYVFITTLATVAIAWRSAHIGQHPFLRDAVLVFCMWRLFEIYRTMLRFVVVDYIGEGYPHTTISAIRYLMYMPQYAIQLILIFAEVYQFWTPHGFAAGGLPPLNGISSFSYVSLTTMTTLGSGYTAVTEAARTWQSLESITGLMLFGLGVTTFLGGLKLRRTHRSEE